jgi:eukaryotic-like serine/threonine-protein kinase
MDPLDPKASSNSPKFDSPTVDDGSSQTVTLDGAAAARARGSSQNLGAYLQPGSLLGERYEILQLLGQGGMGAVYKANDRELDRVVALKIVRPDMADHPNLLQRFKHELILARQIAHRNVIRIFDLGEAGGIKFISMEYVEGENLATLLRTHGRFAPDQAAQIMYQVFRALEAAHAEGVIHRDLKPHNIMRDLNGKIVVMDFGLARSAEVSAVTRSGALVGTLEYMAPEQGQGQHVDERSDIYSAGLIFYQLLTGKMPFVSESAVASLIKRSQERVVPPVQRDPTVPKALSDIVVRCLEIDPKDRYQNVQEVIHELALAANITMGESVTGFIPPVPRRQPIRRIWKWTAAAVLAIALLAGGIGLRKWLGSEVQTIHKPVALLVADFTNQTGDAVFDGTLEPSFNLALEGASFITAYNRATARKIGAQINPQATGLDEALARLVARREGISVVVTGKVARAGEGYKITTYAVDAVTGTAIALSEADAPNKEGVLSGVSTLAARVRRALGDSTPESVQLAQAETFSATSLEAAQHYARGQDFQGTGKWEDAIREYNEALKFDPKLGRAYAGLAVSSYNIGKREEMEQYYKLALSHIDRMSDREKYRTRGGYYMMVARDPDKAIEEFSGLVREFPADSVAISNLALSYFYKRDLTKAMQEGRRFLEVYPKNVPARNNLGLYAMYAGDFDTAIAEQQAVLELNKDFVLAYVGMALSQLGEGKIDEARATWEKLKALNGHGASVAAAGLADLALYQGDVGGAQALLKPAIAAELAAKDTDSASVKNGLLINSYMAAGQPAKAAGAADAALKVSKDLGVRLTAARAYAEAGEEKKALAIAAEMEKSLASEQQLYAQIIHANVDLKRNDARSAVEKLRAALKIGDGWLAHFDLGRAYLAAGAFAEADGEFETCLKRRGEATAVYLDENPSYHLLAPVYYYQGRAREGLNSPAAAESYKSFLAIQGKGDASFLVADAKRRVKH